MTYYAALCITHLLKFAVHKVLKVETFVKGMNIEPEQTEQYNFLSWTQFKPTHKIEPEENSWAIEGEQLSKSGALEEAALLWDNPNQPGGKT